MIIKRFILTFAIIALGTSLHIFVSILDGVTDEVGPADLGVIFGSQILSSGAPSPRLKARLDAGIEFFRKGYFPKILVSGGVDPDGLNEARGMAAYLEKNGIPSEAIILDENGRNTYWTALNTRRILTENRLGSVFSITHYYHISRARLAFNRAGIQIVYSGSTRGHHELRELYSLFREFVAYYYYLFRPFD